MALTQEQKRAHLESAPRTFAGTDEVGARRAESSSDPIGLITSKSAHSRETFDRMAKLAEELTPADAVRFAQRLLIHVEAYGIDYGDFQSAQATQRYVRRASSALRGLAL